MRYLAYQFTYFICIFVKKTSPQPESVLTVSFDNNTYRAVACFREECSEVCSELTRASEVGFFSFQSRSLFLWRPPSQILY